MMDEKQRMNEEFFALVDTKKAVEKQIEAMSDEWNSSVFATEDSDEVMNYKQRDKLLGEQFDNIKSRIAEMRKHYTKDELAELSKEYKSRKKGEVI